MDNIIKKFVTPLNPNFIFPKYFLGVFDFFIFLYEVDIVCAGRDYQTTINGSGRSKNHNSCPNFRSEEVPYTGTSSLPTMLIFKATLHKDI